MKSCLVVALAATAAFASISHAADRPAAPTGTWVISKVSTNPEGVAALVENDPSYLNATLTFTGKAITWDTRKANGQGTYDGCKAPNFVSGGKPGVYSVTCGGKTWGPDATLTKAADNRWVLAWYDGGFLTLTKK